FNRNYLVVERASVESSQLFRKFCVVGQVAAGARKRLAIGGKACLQPGQELVAQKIAVVARIRVAVVLYPLQFSRLGAGQDLGAFHLEQRTQNTRMREQG